MRDISLCKPSCVNTTCSLSSPGSFSAPPAASLRHWTWDRRRAKTMLTWLSFRCLSVWNCWISVIPAWPGFALGLCGWFFILFEIFAGEAGGSASDCSKAVATSFNNMRMIVTVGWAIYPLGYLFGYLLGAVDETYLNVIYNVADF